MKQIKSIYISGKITGLSEKQVRDNFRTALRECYRMELCNATLDTFVNPLDIKPFLGIKSWTCYMIADIAKLIKCDAIYMQRNWRESRGARLELAIAILFKKKIYLQ